MRRRPSNLQLFALRQSPPGEIELGGRRYRLVRVFKHDFFAATCLYEATEPAAADLPRVVVKMGREQPFCGFPIAWYAHWMRAHEEAVYRMLQGVRGVPRWAGRLGTNGYAIEYIDARPLDHVQQPPEGFFDRLRELFDAIHARGVAYGDANKRSNILVGPAEQPYLVDYQISPHLAEDWPWPLRAILRAAVRYMAEKDLYHLYKHKRRMSPQELTDEEERLSRPRGALLALHRAMLKPYHALRRRFLRRQFQTGALQSPTEKLEDRLQPEKETWRQPSDNKP